MQRRRSSYQECDSISRRQVIQMSVVITWILSLGVDVRKLLLANTPVIADIYGAGGVLKNQALTLDE